MEVFIAIVNRELCISLKSGAVVAKSAEVDGLVRGVGRVLMLLIPRYDYQYPDRGTGGKEMGETLENLEGMNERDLRDLIQRAQSALQERTANRLEELRQLAKEVGYEVTLTKIGESEGRRGKRARTGKGGRADRRAEVSAKYQNPDNPSDKWSGRGRKPRWVEMAVTHGRRLEDLAIPAG
jgi:DNA-binding protein H-NS